MSGGPKIARTLAGGYHSGVVQTIPQPSPASAPPVLLLTRPAGDAQRVLDALAKAGAPQTRVVLSPLLEIVHLSAHIDTSWPSELIFSSAQGVFAARDAFSGNPLPCHVVGQRTADAAQAAGHRVVSCHRDAAHLLAALAHRQDLGAILHVRGRHARGNIAQTLVKSGISAREVVAYDQRTMPLSEEARTLAAGEAPVIIPLFSPRTAAQFRAEWRGPAPIHGIALSRAVTDEVSGMPWAGLITAPEPTLAALVTTLVDTLFRELG